MAPLAALRVPYMTVTLLASSGTGFATTPPRLLMQDGGPPANAVPEPSGLAL